MTMHGTIMIFFVLTAGLSGTFANFLIPLQVGARDMASPFINMLSYWSFFVASVIMLASFFVPGGPSGVGWSRTLTKNSEVTVLASSDWPPLSADEKERFNGMALDRCFKDGSNGMANGDHFRSNLRPTEMPVEKSCGGRSCVLCGYQHLI